MANLKEIQKRIGSVKNTEKITYAMYMVSAAKLRKAQEGAENSRPYAESLAGLIGNIVSRVEKPDHPLLVPREDKKRAEVVLFTSDRGLCGGFNSNLIKMAVAFMEDNKEVYDEIDVSVVGKKAADYFRRRKLPVRNSTENLMRTVSYQLATALADELTMRYVSGEVDAVYLVFAKFKSAMTQIPTVVQLLPFSFGEEASEEAEAEPEVLGVDYIYEPSAPSILAELLPRQVRTQIYTSMLESIASEHGARMTAMDSASSNAAEMIDSLTLQFNRARQAAITTELMEIIGGAEALKG